VWKGSATKKSLDIFGSPHLTIGYLISRCKGISDEDRCLSPMSESWAEKKTLIMGTNTRCARHVQGWCIGALVDGCT
jgi:hypothetical protein